MGAEDAAGVPGPFIDIKMMAEAKWDLTANKPLDRTPVLFLPSALGDQVCRALDKPQSRFLEVLVSTDFSLISLSVVLARLKCLKCQASLSSPNHRSWWSVLFTSMNYAYPWSIVWLLWLKFLTRFCVDLFLLTLAYLKVDFLKNLWFLVSRLVSSVIMVVVLPWFLWDVLSQQEAWDMGYKDLCYSCITLFFGKSDPVAKLAYFSWEKKIKDALIKGNHSQSQS